MWRPKSIPTLTRSSALLLRHPVVVAPPGSRDQVTSSGSFLITTAAAAVSTDAFDCLNSLGNNIPHKPFPGLVILSEESVIGRADDNWIQCASYQILLIK